jgi:NADPH:quinone reductase
VIPADNMDKMTYNINYEQGAYMMIKGMTVWYLKNNTFKV